MTGRRNRGPPGTKEGPKVNRSSAKLEHKCTPNWNSFENLLVPVGETGRK
ncbi:hypothetical protein AVEN_260574-1, partial [Araneus ventricosus]